MAAFGTCLINDVQPKTLSNGRVGFICPFCLKFHRHKHALQYHYETHTGEKPYVCPDCHNKIYQRSDLKTHLKIHTGDEKRMYLVGALGGEALVHVQDLVDGGADCEMIRKALDDQFGEVDT